MKTALIIAFILVVYISLNTYVTIKINKANYLKEERRRLHKKLIWIVPFLGPLAIRSFWSEGKVEIKAVTKKDRKIDKGSFHESNKGIFG